MPFTDPWSSDSDLSDLSPVEDEYAKVDKSRREPPDLGDVTAPVADEPRTTVSSPQAASTTTVTSAPVTNVAPPAVATVPSTTVSQPLPNVTSISSASAHVNHSVHTVPSVPQPAPCLPEVQ